MLEAVDSEGVRSGLVPPCWEPLASGCACHEVVSPPITGPGRTWASTCGELCQCYSVSSACVPDAGPVEGERLDADSLGWGSNEQTPHWPLGLSSQRVQEADTYLPVTYRHSPGGKCPPWVSGCLVLWGPAPGPEAGYSGSLMKSPAPLAKLEIVTRGDILKT